MMIPPDNQIVSGGFFDLPTCWEMASYVNMALSVCVCTQDIATYVYIIANDDILSNE